MHRRDGRIPLMIVLALLFVGALLAWIASRDTGEGAASAAYPASAWIHGASLEEWSARQWQWTLGMPVDTNPGLDATGENCTAGQSGPVLFMPRNLAPCTVPEGSTVMIPVAGGECSSFDPAPFSGSDEQALRDCAAREADRYVNIAVTVDGAPIEDIGAYRTSTPLFSAMLPERNVLGAPAGATWVVADGYTLLLRPLDPGEHTIIVHTETADGVVLPDKLLQLTVVEPSWVAPVTPEPAGAEATPLPFPRATPPPATPSASPLATPVTN